MRSLSLHIYVLARNADALCYRLNSNIGTTEATEASIREHFDEALKAVASELSDRVKLVEDHRNVISIMQEKLSASRRQQLLSEQVQ